MGRAHTRGPQCALVAWFFDEPDLFAGVDRQIAEWAQYTDLSVLQHPKLGSQVDDTILKDWSQMGISFPSLKTLTIDIRPQHGLKSTAQFYHEACWFLEGLPPLTELCLAGWNSRIPVESIVNAHGSSLLKLIIKHSTWQCLNEREIRLIGKKCPYLEEFSTRIRRTMGDAREVAVYRALYIQTKVSIPDC